MTTSSTKMHRYGMLQPIWQQLDINTDNNYIIRCHTFVWEPATILEPVIMGFNHFWMFVTFQNRGLHHLDMYCTLIIESSIHFDCRYLELWNTCIICLVFIVLNVIDGTESKYPSIIFLSIYYLKNQLLFRSNYCLLVYESLLYVLTTSLFKQTNRLYIELRRNFLLC